MVAASGWTSMKLKALVFALVMCTTILNGHAQKETVVIRPVKTLDVLVNPGMGITTFQRFNGQELNPSYTWSERGPVEKLHDANSKPDFADTFFCFFLCV